jgi:hypothetical protein
MRNRFFPPKLEVLLQVQYFQGQELEFHREKGTEDNREKNPNSGIFFIIPGIVLSPN